MEIFRRPASPSFNSLAIHCIILRSTAKCLKLAVTAKLLCERGDYAKAAAINEIVKDKLAAAATTSGRRIMRKALQRLANLSLGFAREGKTAEAREINAIIQRYLGDTEEIS